MVKIAKVIVLVLSFVLVFAMFNGKIWDPDFWWHLKTGEYISLTKSLPSHDPFSFTSLPKDPINPESKRIKFILTQYWAAQLIFYFVYKALGFQGIIYMRALILTLIILLLYRGIRREGAGFFPSLALIAPAVIIFYNFTGERPQLFSFLFSFLIIYLIEGYRKASFKKIAGPADATSKTGTLKSKSEIRYILPVPFLMIIWANMHGGFVIGVAVIAGYIFLETAKHLLKRLGPSLPADSLKYLIVFGISSILLSLVNPNGYNVIPVLIELNKSLYLKMIVEAKSPLVFIKDGYYAQELFTFFLLLFSGILLFLINIKRLDITDGMIFTAFAGLSLSAARVIPFFTPVAIFMISRYGIKTFEHIKQKRWLMPFKRTAEKPLLFLKSPFMNILTSALLIVLIIFIMNNNKFFQNGIRKGRYPEGAARFLKENRIPGNMYNPYVWGGYLIWALYPDYKVFIDGRGLIEEIFFQGDKIIKAYPLNFAGVPEWKAMLNAYDINFIVTFTVGDFSGKLVPLIPALRNDPEWHLIYMDNNSVIFLREKPKNEEIIRKFGMPKEWVWNTVITEAAQKAREFRGNINYYITMGDAYLEKKSYMDALTAYLKAQEINPQDNTVKEKLKILRNTTSR